MEGQPVSSERKEEKLFGQSKWDVENAADTIVKAREMETAKPELFAAAMKLLERKKNTMVAILHAGSVTGKSK